MAIKTPREKAIAWMRENGHVLGLFERFAKELADKERPISMHVLSGRVRYEYIQGYKPGDGEYKINQNHSPYIARYLLWKHPEWKKFLTYKLARHESEVVPITDADLREVVEAA